MQMSHLPERQTTNDDSNLNSFKIPSAVQHFQDFLHENGGHAGGWEAYDHRIFLRRREKHKGRPGFIEDVAERLCGQTLDSVNKHEEWYQEYLEKQHKQQLAIREWRNLKQTMQKEQQQSQEDLRQKVQVIRTDTEQVKFAIETWKQKVQDEKQVKEQTIKEEELKKQKLSAERWRKHEAELHKKIQPYKEARKQQELEEQQLQEELRRKDELDRLARKIPQSYFFHRDALRLVAKQHKKNQLIQEEEQKRERLLKLANQVSVTAVKDSARLMSPTKAWITKINPSENEEHIIRAPFKLPRRRIPEWRSGIAL